MSKVYLFDKEFLLSQIFCSITRTLLIRIFGLYSLCHSSSIFSTILHHTTGIDSSHGFKILQSSYIFLSSKGTFHVRFFHFVWHMRVKLLSQVIVNWKLFLNYVHKKLSDHVQPKKKKL